MTAFFADILYLLATYRYPMAFFGSLLEGPLAMIGGGMLLHLGQFEFLPLYVALVSGDLVADIFWYFIGRQAAEPFIRRFGRFFGVTREVFEKMEAIFRKHDTKILFISKITMGLGFAVATLMAAGAVRVSFRKYIVLNLIGGLVWSATLIFVGYFFGYLYSQIAEGFKIIFVGALAATVIAAMYGFVSFVRRTYGHSLS